MSQTKTFSAITAVFFVYSMVSLVNSAALNKKYCRREEGVSRCVEEPLMVDDEDLWCPYRVCGPSYVAAPECPSGSEQATHKCKVTTVDDPIHVCVAGKVHKTMKLPVGCDNADPNSDTCESEARVCACEQVNPSRTVLSPEFRVYPDC